LSTKFCEQKWIDKVILKNICLLDYSLSQQIKILYGVDEIEAEFGIGTGTGGEHCFLGRKNN